MASWLEYVVVGVYGQRDNGVGAYCFLNYCKTYFILRGLRSHCKVLGTEVI